MSGDLYTGPRLVGSLRARPTVYRGIHMRSRLEAKVAASLDQHGIPWEYEPMAYASPAGQYLPDFQLWPEHRGECTDTGPRHPLSFLEIKGATSLAILEPTKRQMEIIWESEPTAALFVAVYTHKGNEFWEGGPLVSTPGYDPSPPDAYPGQPLWWKPTLYQEDGVADYLCTVDGCALCIAELASWR